MRSLNLRMARIALAAFPLLAGEVALGQTAPLEMKGVQLGGTAVDVKALFPDAWCRHGSCGIDVYELQVKKCGQQPASACWSSVGNAFQFGPVTPSTYRFNAVDGRFGELRVVFYASYFEDVVAALKIKYGEPTSVRMEVMGSAPRGRVVEWSHPAGMIAALQHGLGTDSVVLMQNHEWITQQQAQRRRATKDAASKL